MTIEHNYNSTVTNSTDPSYLAELANSTNARICVGRSGTRFTTQTLLKFRLDHAIANDAVWSAIDQEKIDNLGFYSIQTKVQDKEEFIRRPDLGRIFDDATLTAIKGDCIPNPDVQIMAADGLSAAAINANIEDIYALLEAELTAAGYTMGTPLFVKYSRVATMDPISEILGAKVTINLIGERPGLATDESMSAYIAYESSAKKPESQRTVISNIHRNGIPPVEAGAQIVSLVKLMMKEKISGIDLKL